MLLDEWWQLCLSRLQLYFPVGGVSIGNVLPAADIAQFKQGVKSVAGKMAVLANGVMNSLQVRKIPCWLKRIDLGRGLNIPLIVDILVAKLNYQTEQ